MDPNLPKNFQNLKVSKDELKLSPSKTLNYKSELVRTNSTNPQTNVTKPLVQKTKSSEKPKHSISSRLSDKSNLQVRKNKKLRTPMLTLNLPQIDFTSVPNTPGEGKKDANERLTASHPAAALKLSKTSPKQGLAKRRGSIVLALPESNNEIKKSTSVSIPSVLPRKDFPKTALSYCIENSKITKTISSSMDFINIPDYEKGEIAQILPHLYLGSNAHSQRISNLKKIGITALINCQKKSITSSDFVVKNVSIEDNCNTDIQSHFNSTFNFIENVRNKGGKVLVYCKAGISRSATICLAYLMRLNHLKWEEAYKLLKKSRPLVGPNFNFICQLHKFEEDCKNIYWKIDHDLNKQSNVIDEIIEAKAKNKQNSPVEKFIEKICEVGKRNSPGLLLLPPSPCDKVSVFQFP